MIMQIGNFLFPPLSFSSFPPPVCFIFFNTSLFSFIYIFYYLLCSVFLRLSFVLPFAFSHLSLFYLSFCLPHLSLYLPYHCLLPLPLIFLFLSLTILPLSLSPSPRYFSHYHLHSLIHSLSPG